MCSKEETKKAANDAVEELLFTPDANGHTRFGREVHDAVFMDGAGGQPSRFQREIKKAFYSTVGKWLIGGGIAIIIPLVSIFFQVKQNTEALDQGGRYTETDALEDARLQEARDSRQDEDIQNLREEINGKLDKIIDRLIP